MAHPDDIYAVMKEILDLRDKHNEILSDCDAAVLIDDALDDLSRLAAYERSNVNKTITNRRMSDVEFDYKAGKGLL